MMGKLSILFQAIQNSLEKTRNHRGIEEEITEFVAARQETGLTLQAIER